MFVCSRLKARIVLPNQCAMFVCNLGCPYSKERKLNRADAIVAPNGPNEPSIGYIGGVGELMGA